MYITENKDSTKGDVSETTEGELENTKNEEDVGAASATAVESESPSDDDDPLDLPTTLQPSENRGPKDDLSAVEAIRKFMAEKLGLTEGKNEKPKKQVCCQYKGAINLLWKEILNLICKTNVQT